MAFAKISLWLKPPQFFRLKCKGTGTRITFSGKSKRQRFLTKSSTKIFSISQTHLYLTLAIARLTGPLYLQATTSPSSRYLPTHPGWVRPSMDCLWQTGQMGFSANSICARQPLQKYCPNLPQPTHFFGKIKSRRENISCHSKIRQLSYNAY